MSSKVVPDWPACLTASNYAPMNRIVMDPRASPAPAATRRGLLGGRLAEFRRVNRDVRFDLGQLGCIPAVEPAESVFEGELDAVDVTVVGEVDLGRHTADWRRAVADDASEQPGLGIEVECGQKPSGPASLNSEVVLIANASLCGTPPVGERLFE